LHPPKWPPPSTRFGPVSNRTYLSDVERGIRNVSLVNIERIARALAMKVSELFQVVEGN
jgi:hypothetical protein